MFDRLLDFLLAFGGKLLPFTILDAYEQGVVLRFGTYQRTIGPGYHWIIPFGVDKVLSDSCVLSTARLNPQSLTTADGTQCVVGAVITSKVRDIRKLLLDCEDKDQALIDMSFGIIAAEVVKAKWDDLHTEEFQDKVTKAVRARGFRFGLEVERVQFSDLARCRSIRLWSGV